MSNALNCSNRFSISFLDVKLFIVFVADVKVEISFGAFVPKNIKLPSFLKIVKSLYKKIPILGVCLGHQIIGQVFGSKIIQAKKLMHGKTSKILSRKTGILKNLPKIFEATRYHSLIIDKKSLSKDLEITAETKDGLIMGVRHKKFHVHGVQFHPESIKTKLGIKILKNFTNIKN